MSQPSPVASGHEMRTSLSLSLWPPWHGLHAAILLGADDGHSLNAYYNLLAAVLSSSQVQARGISMGIST